MVSRTRWRPSGSECWNKPLMASEPASCRSSSFLKVRSRRSLSSRTASYSSPLLVPQADVPVAGGRPIGTWPHSLFCFLTESSDLTDRDSEGAAQLPHASLWGGFVSERLKLTPCRSRVPHMWCACWQLGAGQGADDTRAA